MNKRFTRALAASSVAFALAAGLAACSGGGSDGGSGGGKVTLTFWDHSGNPTRAEKYRELVKDFEATHKNIEVDFLELPSDSAFEKIQTSIAANQAPDLAALSGAEVAPLSAQNALLDIDDQFNASPLKDELDAALVDGTRQDARDGKLYALPYTLTYGILWYRTDLWKGAGMADGPATWDTFYEGTKDLSKDGQYGFAMRGGAGGPYQFLQAIYAQSGVKQLFDDKGVSTLDDPANVEALKRYAALYKTATSDADLGYGFPEMVAAFDGGTVATMQHNLGSYAEHKKALDGKFAGLPLPAAADGTHNVITDPVPAFSIFKQSKHPEESWEFLQYLMGADANGALNETIGQIPANTESRKAEWLGKSQSVSTARKWIEGDDVNLISPPTYLPDFATILTNTMEPDVQNLLLGKLSAEDCLKHWAEVMTAAQQKYMGDK